MYHVGLVTHSFIGVDHWCNFKLAELNFRWWVWTYSFAKLTRNDSPYFQQCHMGFIMQELIELLGFWDPSSLSHSAFQVSVFIPWIVSVWAAMCSLGWGGSLAMMVSMYEHPIICTFFHGLLLSKRNKSFWWGSFLWLHPLFDLSFQE
jgi:hypothetical protein